MGAYSTEAQTAWHIADQLRLVRTLSLVWVLIGIVPILLAIYYIAFPYDYYYGYYGNCGYFGSGCALPPGYYAGWIALIVYGVAWMLVSGVIYIKAAEWASMVQQRYYQMAHDQMFLWSIVGIIFGIIPGIFLLIVAIRLPPLYTAQAFGPPPSYGYPR